VVAIVAVFFLVTRFTWISIDERPSDGPISVVGESKE
jgi:hypothetical protein